MPDPFDLRGRVAVVTGSTRGIGLAIANRLAVHGADLVINGRDSAVVAGVAAQLRATHGVKVAEASGDAAESRTHAALVRCALALGKRLDIYINNAGLLRNGLIGMIPDSDVDMLIGLNLRGTLFGVQSAARAMRRSGGGSIVNISSILGRFGDVGHLAYSASKAGVIGATRAAARELAPFNIRVNTIAPGFIDTEMTAGLSREHHAARVASIGLSRAGTANDVANAALFLAGDLSSYVTGQTIGVDGGMRV